MNQTQPPHPDPFFTAFEAAVSGYTLPERFTYPFACNPHPLCMLAAEQLQRYLNHQTDWIHNFGLSAQQEGTIIGKMFGVLLVQTAQQEIGYLSAFSGKLAGRNHHTVFVPPVFDTLAAGGFLNDGMEVLSRMTETIRELEEKKNNSYEEELLLLKQQRKNHSVTLQNELFDHYYFVNQAGEEKSLRALFVNTSGKNPPSGAGECAAPKLLQYAFLHQMKPLALAEFWWGESPKSDTWQHGHFYPCCHEKCEPILTHMLKGMAVDEKPDTVF